MRLESRPRRRCRPRRPVCRRIVKLCNVGCRRRRRCWQRRSCGACWSQLGEHVNVAGRDGAECDSKENEFRENNNSGCSAAAVCRELCRNNRITRTGASGNSTETAGGARAEAAKSWGATGARNTGGYGRREGRNGGG